MKLRHRSFTKLALLSSTNVHEGYRLNLGVQCSHEGCIVYIKHVHSCSMHMYRVPGWLDAIVNSCVSQVKRICLLGLQIQTEDAR